MQIELSDKAQIHVRRKLDFFRYKNRKPRLIEVAKTCHGAEFRLVFELPLETDKLVMASGMELYVPQNLLEEYQGFSLDVQSFFFAPRLLIEPFKQSYYCNCAVKCNKKIERNIEEK